MDNLVTLRDNSIQLNQKTKIILTLPTIIILSLMVPPVSATFVEMEKSHKPEKTSYNCGEIVQFNITLTVRTVEDGPILSIKNLKIIDELPPGTTFLTGNRTSTPTAVSFMDYGNGTLLWDFGPGPFTGDPQVTTAFNVP